MTLNAPPNRSPLAGQETPPPAWSTWFQEVYDTLRNATPGSGTVTDVSVASSNGFAGTVATPTSTPVITIKTTVTGLLSGNGTSISAASTTGSGDIVLSTSPTLVTPALGTPSALVGTNITGTGASFTSGHATALTTGRTISITGDISYTSPSFDGSSNVTAAGTLATVNSNVGSFTNANITVNAKGLITAASNGTGGSGTGWANGGYATNRYYWGIGFLPGSVGAMTANRMYCRPFVVGASETFTRIGTEVTSSSAGNARIGIYNWANGAPTTLVSDLGTVSTSSNAQVEITISQALSPGIYGIAIVFSATPSVRLADVDFSVSSDLFGEGTSTSSTFYLYTALTYGALPTPFGTPTYVTGTSGPGVWVRKV